jgi:hypothetical protein
MHDEADVLITRFVVHVHFSMPNGKESYGVAHENTGKVTVLN